MTPDDPDQLRRKLEAFDARRTRHERIGRAVFILMTFLAAVASGLMLYQLLNR